MLTTLITGLAIGLTLYLGLCLLLFLMQRSMIYLPQPREPVPGTAAMTVPGEIDIVLSVAATEQQRALLYFGGNAEAVAYSVPELVADFPDRAIYAMHYRGYGSPGSPSERALVADALAVFDQLQQRHPDILLLGRSLGSGIAVQVASQRRIEGLMLVTPYDSIENLAAAQFPWVPVRWLLLDTYRSAQYIQAVTAPTLIIAAARDEVIPLASSRALHDQQRAAAPGIPSRLEILPGATHNDISVHPRYRSVVRDWLAGIGTSAGRSTDAAPP